MLLFSKTKYPTYVYRLLYTNFFSIDATKEISNSYGRLINHSLVGNITAKSKIINKKPFVYFVASRNLEANEEVFYNYGDDTAEVKQNLTWYTKNYEKGIFLVY